MAADPAVKLPGAGGTALASERVREKMAERIRQLGVRDGRVLRVMAAVPRHLFVDAALASRAYEETALPIGHGQTISRPYTVARCAELLLEAIPEPSTARVLEVGTGCGYAAAVLSQLFGTVITVERLRPLHEQARANLRPFRLPNVRLVFGDGTVALKDQPAFHGVIAAAAGEQLAPAWIAQMAVGGRLVAPIGGEEQRLIVANKSASGRIAHRVVEAARFVPLKSGTG